MKKSIDSPRQRVVEAVATCLIFKWNQDADIAVKIAGQIVDDEIYRLGDKERQYIDSIDTDTKASRFVTSVKDELLDIMMTDHRLAQILSTGFALKKVDATAYLYYANNAKLLSQGEVILYHDDQFLLEFDRGTPGFSEVKSTVLTWSPRYGGGIPKRTGQINRQTFDKPSHLIGNHNVQATKYIKGDTDLMYVLRTLNRDAVYAAIMRPSNDIILFDGEPHASGKPLCFIPQTVDGIWNVIFDRVDKWETYVPTIIDDVEIVTWRTKPPFDLDALPIPSDVKIDVELNNPAHPDQDKPSSHYGNHMAGFLFHAGIWLGRQSIKIIDPYVCHQNWLHYIDESDPKKRGVFWSYGNDKYEIIVRPTVVKAYDPFAPDVKSSLVIEESKKVALLIAGSDKHKWSFNTDLWVSDVMRVSYWLDEGIITVDDLRSYFNPKTNTTNVHLSIIDVSDDEQTSRVVRQLGIVVAEIIALKCRFNVTRISSVNSNQMIDWVLTTLTSSEVMGRVINQREVVELYDSMMSIIEDQETTLNVLVKARDRAYHVTQDDNPIDHNDLAGIIWQVETMLFDTTTAQMTRDYLTELVAVCAHDLAKMYGFNPMVITRKTNQFVQRIIRQSVQVSSAHQHAWHSLNADEKNDYAEMVKNHSLTIASTEPRPKHFEIEVVS